MSAFVLDTLCNIIHKFYFSHAQTILITGRETLPAIQNETENTKSDFPRDLYVYNVIQFVGRKNTPDHRVWRWPVYETDYYWTRVISLGTFGYNSTGCFVERCWKVFSGRSLKSVFCMLWLSKRRLLYVMNVFITSFVRHKNLRRYHSLCGEMLKGLLR